jgi:acyl-CoA thioesterase II
VATTLAKIVLGTSDHRSPTPYTKNSTLAETAVEITDTMVYRKIFLPSVVFSHSMKRSTNSGIAATLTKRVHRADARFPGVEMARTKVPPAQNCQHVRVSDALDELVRLLDLEPIEFNIFRGTQPDEERQRVFGGQVAGQALMAAGRTVEAGTVHSLHAYFLRPGDPTVPILYEVDRIRDGRSFSTRRVVAIQRGQAIFNLSASFHVEEAGPEHQIAMPEVPDPETLPTLPERLEQWRDRLSGWHYRPHPIDQRYIGSLPWVGDSQPEPRQQLWLRADGQLPDDPLLHACVAVYASDLSLYDTIVKGHEVRWDAPYFMGASLDHCMWFHRPFRADEWLLYDTESPIATAARGLARGFFFDSAGRLVASVAQEGLVRFLGPTPNN